MEEIKNNNHYSFLAIGKTQESTEGGNSFKRYVGIGSSYILAVNPTKQQADELLGYDTKEPQYVGEDEQGKYVDIIFIIRTDPKANNGIEITNSATIRMRPAPATNKDGNKCQVVDGYGNFAWVDITDADAGNKIEYAQKLSTSYRKAGVGECALIDLLKKYLCVPDAYDYKNGVWIKKPEEQANDGIFALEHIKDYFSGDVSEIRDAIARQPNNKVKFLYGVKTTDTKQYQTVCLTEGMVLPNGAGAKSFAKLEKDLTGAKQSGKFANIDYRVQELQEWTVEPTNLEAASAASSDAMPWD